MSDEEIEDEDYFIEPYRDDLIRQDCFKNVEILNQKTINFEDLLNELVRQGVLSFEEKFKILSGIVDETTANKTIPEKCNELYQTLLVRKKTPLAKILKAWEDTGNSYLVGRFDTHFSLEGRDSKSLKFHKFKALPSHRTEFLTHLHLKQLTLSPKNLLKCLRKSGRLVSIRLERIKVPYGGRASDDPSSDFDQPLILPNLKEFYFEEISKHEPFASLREASFFLDELNLKPMLFFGLNPNMAWDSGINITVKMRGVTILQLQPDPQDQGQGQGSEFKSMLRRRPTDYGGFINPEKCHKICLYECYVPKTRFHEGLKILIIYRCKLTSFDTFFQSLPNLQHATLYGEFETNNFPQLDLSFLTSSRSSLTSLALGYVAVSLPDSDPESEPLNLDLSLDSLLLDTCLLKIPSPQLSKTFTRISSLSLISLRESTLKDFLLSFAPQSIQKILVKSLNRDQDDPDPDLSSLTGGKASFLLERLESESKQEESSDSKLNFAKIWKAKDLKIDALQVVYESGRFSEFMPFSEAKGWLDLPLKQADEGQVQGPRDVFRETHGY